MNLVQDLLKTVYFDLTGKEPVRFEPIPGSGSPRQYFRIGEEDLTVIGVYNEDYKENQAFISFTRSFLQQKLPVPEILTVSEDGLCYLLRDLGDMTLFGFLQESRGRDYINHPGSGIFSGSARTWYQHVLDWLPKFQVLAKPNYSLCYPRSVFDRQSMLWDLNYFKYYYLKLAGVPFDEQLLEDDFNQFTSFLLQAPSGFFMYRDFQSRNIMLYDDNTWFIDYQGGRKGALQYDIASLLYDSKADIPDGIKTELLDYYLNSLGKILSFDRKEFLKYYPGFALIRILQAMGAYGFRGYYQKKSHFLQSIPFALKNLGTMLDQLFLENFPELKKVLISMVNKRDIINIPEGNTAISKEQTSSSSPGISSSDDKPYELTVLITSFSYFNGPPEDKTGHGGGFIFDCRALPNPGRFTLYRDINGMDKPVIDFLMKEPDVNDFLSHVFSLVDQSVQRYIHRKFTNLMVSFGCTGGQHRSVFCAEALARHLSGNPKVRIKLNHREMDEWAH
jgi:aminoglycoside/choline kinase family phosphotransferase